jgi:solute carrier family 24 (sodium/potassium/calcium exchanger), member 4
VQLDWWPISRDCILLLINLIMLTVIVWDGRVEWYESCIQVGALIFYFAVMFQNARLQRFFEKYLASWCCFCRNVDFGAFEVDLKRHFHLSFTILLTDGEANQISPVENPQKPVILDEEDDVGLWRAPAGSVAMFIWWIFTWPIRLVLTLTIPNCKTYPKLFALTFVMCMLLLAVSSYMIFWMMVIIGHTFAIPDAVMGMTFLAAGGCLPEVASAVLMIRTGSGALGVSNSLGANSLAIMFSLGLPWFLRVTIDGGPISGAYFAIESYGIEFIVLALILAVVTLYAVITVGKYLLRTSIGVILALIYVIFVTFAILVEVDVLFASGHRC